MHMCNNAVAACTNYCLYVNGCVYNGNNVAQCNVVRCMFFGLSGNRRVGVPSALRRPYKVVRFVYNVNFRFIILF